MALGTVLTLAVLMLPPVQRWILQRAFALQPGAAMELGHVAVGPGGAEAADVRLRLPNLTVEARALRLAISPWQLLSRRRLAIADLQARELAIRASSSSEPGSSAPFNGLLEGLQAPLAWACSKAEADGVLLLEQPGAAPVRASFRVSGADLDITRPGQIDLEFATPGNLVPGFAGQWQFRGKLDFAPAPDGSIDSVVLDGRVSPAIRADLQLPELHIRVRLARSAEGETCDATLEPIGAEALAGFSVHASFLRGTHQVTGTWEGRGGTALAAKVLRRDDLPAIETNTRGKFVLDTVSGAGSADADGDFFGTDWQRLLPELKGIARLHGHHSLTLVRRGATWQLDKLTATAGSDGSSAALQLALVRPLALPPGGDGETTPWGRISVEKIPLGWAAPLLGVARIAGGEVAGTWSISSPGAGALRFAPDGPLTISSFTPSDAALPKIPALSGAAEASLDLTATSGTLAIRRATLHSAAGDRVDGDLEAALDLDQLTAETSVHWQAQLPSWLGGAQAPRVEGRATASVGADTATVHTLRVAALQGEREEAFALESLAPFKINYAREVGIEAAEGDLLRFSAHDLRLDWAAPLLPGFSLSGRVASGESILRREGRTFAVKAGAPWTVADLDVVQGGLPLLRSPRFELSPEGQVQLDENWVPRDFVASIKLGGKLAEVFRLRDPAGLLAASGSAQVQRIGDRVELRGFQFDVKRADRAGLLTLETVRPILFAKTAKGTDIDKAADSLRLQTAAVPLEWLQPLLPAGMRLTGTLEPSEFVAKIELPNFQLGPTRPLGVAIRELDNAEGPMLRDARLEISPMAMGLGQFVSFVVENGRVVLNGREAGKAGIGALYFTNNLQIPISASVDVSADIAQLRAQPVATTLPLPPTGTARVLLDHDLTKDNKSSITVLLSDVQAPNGAGALPRLGARLTLLGQEQGLVRMNLEFQYQTAPTWSAFTAELALGMRQDKARLQAKVQGDFFDVGSFMQLVQLCAPVTRRPAAPNSAKVVPGDAAPTPPPTQPFWQAATGRFDLKFGKVVYDAYTVEDITGEFEADDTSLHLRKLSGRMFDGDWGGNVRLGFDRAEAARPYQFEGDFGITHFSAERIVQAAYPTELGSFSGRLNFSSHVTSRGADFRRLLEDSTSEFSFDSEGGRLQLKVPHANLASAALLVGGTVAFSPELRAIGRLVKKFSDLPVEKLSASGRRGPDGAIALTDFRLYTPQLRLSGRGEVPAQPNVELAARRFELPVTLAVRDEMAVLLKGMKLIGKKADADGFFTMTRQPTLRGTLGAPDTTDLYDVFAQAVSGSSGTFGFLMKKVQQEVTKAQKPAP